MSEQDPTEQAVATAADALDCVPDEHGNAVECTARLAAKIAVNVALKGLAEDGPKLVLPGGEVRRVEAKWATHPDNYRERTTVYLLTDEEASDG